MRLPTSPRGLVAQLHKSINPGFDAAGLVKHETYVERNAGDVGDAALADDVAPNLTTSCLPFPVAIKRLTARCDWAFPARMLRLAGRGSPSRSADQVPVASPCRWLPAMAQGVPEMAWASRGGS